MKKKVITFIGGAGHGKDTCCDLIKRYCIENHIPHVRYEHTAFADVLKEQARMIGWDGDKDFGGRQFLIDFTPPVKAYGNWLAKKYPEEYGMYANDNYYSAKLYEVIKESGYKYFFVSDMRFICEYEFFRNREDIDFVCVRVIREDEEGYFTNGLTSDQLNSPSEMESKQMSVNCEIHNNGSIEDLYQKICEAVKELNLFEEGV